MAVIRMNFLSQAIGMQTNVTICLPTFSFADTMKGRKDVYVPGMKYQVLYLLHGGLGDDSDYLHFTNITRYADEHKLAVVMPADYNMGYEDNEKGKFMTYVAEELPKMCQAMFPFSDKREDNFIGGLSMGSMGAQKIAAKYPEQYAAVLAMSAGAFGLEAAPKKKEAGAEQQFLDETIAARKTCEANIAAGKSFPKFFMTWGDKDFVGDGHKESCEYLKELGVDIYEEIVPGYGHEWDFWDLTLRKAFKEWLPIRHEAIYP